jgi:hypothetical protein
MPMPDRRVRACTSAPRAVEVHRAAPCRWLSAQSIGGCWILSEMVSNPRSLHITQPARSCCGGRHKTWRGAPEQVELLLDLFAAAVRWHLVHVRPSTPASSTSSLACWSTA